MNYSEAKQFLKEGMKIRITHAHGCVSAHEGVFTFIGKNTVRESTHCLSNLDELVILTEAGGLTPWKDPRGVNLGSTYCAHCTRNLCQCPERQSDGSWQKAEEPKFKVGDRVKCIKGCLNWLTEGKIYTITNIGHEHLTHVESDEGGSVDISHGRFEKLPDKPTTATEVAVNSEWGSMGFWSPSPFEKYYNQTYDNYVLQILTKGASTTYTSPGLPKKQPTMNNIFQAIKAKLKPTDRALVKHGYLNSDGSRTSMYEDQLREEAIKKLVEAEDTTAFRKELADELSANEE